MTISQFLELPNGVHVIDSDGDTGYLEDDFVIYDQYNDATRRRVAWYSFGPYTLKGNS